MKKITLLITAVSLCFTAFATPTNLDYPLKPNKPTKGSDISFMHALGAGAVFAWDDVASAASWAASYTPRLCLSTSKYTALHLTAPIMLGLVGNSRDGFSSAIDLPIAIEYAFGYGSTPKAYRKDFGMYFGAGGGIVGVASYDAVGFPHVTGYAGAQFDVADYPIDLRLGYGVGLGESGKGGGKFTISAAYILTYQ